MCPSMWAHWRHLANTIELVLPSAYPSPRPKRQIDWFSRFCTAHGRKSMYFTMATLSPKLPILVVDLDSHLIHDSLSRLSPQSKRHHCLNCFVQVTAECSYTLQWAPLSQKIAPSPGELDSHLTCDSLGPSEPINQTASLSVQPFLHM